MKLLEETRNLSKIESVKVYCILGYDIYIPKAYDTPISFLKKGCPIWINYNESGDCRIYESNGIEYLYSSLVKQIKTTFPKRNGYYCAPLYQTMIQGIYEFSSACYNENNDICAMIEIKYNKELTQEKGVECAEVSNLTSDSDDALKVLSNYIFSDEIVNKHRALLIHYYPKNRKDRHNAMVLGLVRKSKDLYWFQME